MKTTKEQRKFALYDRMKNLGFDTYEAAQLIRIERTLHRWAEEMCNGTIERDEKTGKPQRAFTPWATRDPRDPRYPNVPAFRSLYFIPDREAGALRRLKAIVDARNKRQLVNNGSLDVLAYHQTDPRGVSLYLIPRHKLCKDSIESAYNRGLAICY